MPKSYLTDEDKVGLDPEGIVAAESAAAANAGDEEAAWEWLRLAALPPRSLMTMKKVKGPDWIRKMGFNTRRAEEIYGKNWLDR